MSKFAQLEAVEERFLTLESQLSQPDVASDPKRFATLMQDYSHLKKLVGVWREYKQVEEELEGAREMLAEDDEEMRELAKAEVSELEERVPGLETALKKLLLPRDPNDGRNVMLEIRAGAGGDEAGLFAYDLFRMYSRYGESRGWRFELMSKSDNAAGGFKEVIATVAGADAWSRLKFESGVHRVQRVPATEAQGRIHTSTCTVALMPEAEEVDVQIADKDLRIDVFRASGPGGQSVNTTDSAVRITHLPSGLIVICQDEKSQHKNKAKAMTVLRTRLYEIEERKRMEEQRDMRLSQVGTGDRSERIRTYNYPQGRITDHRVGLTLYTLDRVIEGAMDDLLDGVANWFETEALKAQESEA
ncbi:MAG: peptide chain release factor 1 [Deltaproteobacteria bacterium]|nr:peptide chain release factor 1 [Deltaproteobacteria bacterium]